MATGQYQGSQAFAHIINDQNESVNPNTGSVSLTLPLVELKGVTESMKFKLTLSYSLGTSGTFGLPLNWSFGLPYVIPGISVTFGGRTYVIDRTWSDSQGYQSGLRYVNNHGMKFQSVGSATRLPSGKPGLYLYQLRHPDGSCDYFDVYGRPLEHDDLFGNSIYFAYIPGHTGSVLTAQPCLQYIEDSWNQQISFNYQPGQQIIITIPDASSTTIYISQQGVHHVSDPLENQTKLSYSTFGRQYILASIQYPTSLRSSFEYKSLPYLDANGDTQYLPAVSDNYQLDSNNNVLKHSNYSYGGETDGLTFTGAGEGYRMAGLQDSLMDSNDVNYKYDVLEVCFDAQGQPLSGKRNSFNSLHLPIIETKYTFDGSQNYFPAFEVRFTYQIDPNQHARATSYALPTQILHFHNTSTGDTPEWAVFRQTDASYNEFGNPVEHDESLCTSDFESVALTSINTIYFTVDSRYQVVQTQTLTDHITQSQLVTENTLSADQKTIDATMTSFTEEGSQQLQTWKEHHFVYDRQGRILQETMAWTAGAPRPPDSITESTSHKTYECSDGVLEETQTDGADNVVVSGYNIGAEGGPLIYRKQPLGQIQKFEYDPIGRLVSSVDELGDRTTFAYTLGAGGNSTKSEFPLGYTQLKMLDVLGREVALLDNGDPTQSSPTISRKLKTTLYDGLSRIVQTIDQYGRVATQTYDALDRQLTATDFYGNVSSKSYDDSKLSVSETLNGDLRKVSILDGLLRTTNTTIYPDSASSCEYCLVHETSFDGQGRKIVQHLSQIARSSTESSTSPQLLTLETIRYDADGNKASTSTSGTNDDGEDVLSRTFSRDLFGNICTWTKTVEYCDGRVCKHSGPVKLYNEANKLNVLKNQMGTEERYEYNANSWLTKTRRCDGTEIHFLYDAAGQIVETVTPSTTTITTYSCIGRVTRVQKGAQSVAYRTSLDGTITSVSIGDCLAQQYVLDAQSRVVRDTNALGTTRETQYDEQGRVSRRICAGDTVTYSYDTINHAYGQLVEIALDGNVQNRRSFSYDGFGFQAQITDLGADSQVLLKTTYNMDSRFRIQSVASSSADQPSLNFERKWQYDGLGQVTADVLDSSGQSTATRYSYDGNSNVLSVDVNGYTSLLTYNALDQRNDAGFLYDGNGRLINDGEGNTFEYDVMDRLLSVKTVANKTIDLEYRADGFLGQRSDGDTVDNFSYDKGKVNAITQTTSSKQSCGVSIFGDPNGLTSAYPSNSNPLYLYEQNGSTVLTLTDGGSVAAMYTSYGDLTGESKLTLPFGFKQELYDLTTGLVYLRSRFYHPTMMAFIVMDTRNQENRYAYCKGDPINFMDPSGHDSAWQWTAFVWSMGMGIFLSVATAGLFDIAATAIFGTEVIETSTAAAVLMPVARNFMAGGIGNLMGSFYQAVLTQTPEQEQRGTGYPSTNARNDFLAGAIGGVVTHVVGLGLSRLIDSVRQVGMASGAIGSGVQTVAGFRFAGQQIQQMDRPQIVLNMLTGATLGGTATRVRFQIPSFPTLRFFGRPLEPMSAALRVTGRAARSASCSFVSIDVQVRTDALEMELTVMTERYESQNMLQPLCRPLPGPFNSNNYWPDDDFDGSGGYGVS